MAPSIVEKYEQILAADPRSRIFVELAKALLERGEAARAVEVCRRGLEHHPSSILGRVIWGRGLLEAGDRQGALDQFDIAIALDPGGPYAYNLVGEALVARGMYREALPALARAAELQPADARIGAWRDEALRRVQEAALASGAGKEAPPRSVPPDPAGAPAGAAAPEPAPSEDERTDPYRPLVRGAAPAAAPDGAPAPSGSTAPDAPSAAAAPPAAHPMPPPAPGDPDAVTLALPLPAPRPPPIRAAGAPPTPPPLRREAAEDREVATPRFVLSMLPGEARDAFGTLPAAPAARPVPPPAPAPDAEEAARIAERYERELREKLLAEPPPRPGFLRRNARPLTAAAALLAVAGALAVYLVVRAGNRAAEAATAAQRARVGIARDTRAALAQAADALARARAIASDPEVISLSAQVNALLAAEHGDAQARPVAAALAQDPAAGDGGIAARWLLAETPEARKAAEAEVLAAGPSSAPLVQAIAGAILLGRGEVDAGRGRLDIAAHATPPLLRALAALGDAALAADDPEGALAYQTAALAAQPTHPRAVVGAAEARLALGRELDRSRRELAAVEADPGSAPPADLRLRYELAFARILAATGDPAAATERLARAGASLGKTAPLSAALAELHLSARAWDRAEAEAARAVALAPADAAARVLLARARNGRGRYAAALEATAGADGRGVRIQRAVAQLGLGQPAAAQAELQKLAHDGRLPAEAAVYYALADLDQGRAERARALLEKLVAARTPPPLAQATLGRALAAEGRLDDAEAAFRAAIARDPAAPEGQAGLGALLLRRGKPVEAVASLEAALRADPSDLVTRLRLGEARLAAGQPGPARADLDAVLLARPRDAAALRLVSAAWLAEGDAGEARRAAERATSAAPRDPAAWLAAARAALAAGDRPAARKFAEQARKLAPKGAEADAARQLLAQAGKR